MPSAPTINLRHLSIKYRSQTVFDDLNLQFAAGKITCLLGTSGAGKSTLLRAIAGLIKPDAGTITCSNQINPADQVAFMAQNDLLTPWSSALQNTLLSVHLKEKISAEHIARARELLRQTGLAGAENKLPQQLSAGMRQRVALTRTLMENKSIVLMDEPFSAVDAITRFQLQNLTAQLLKNRTVILVTHDPLEALRLADEIYVMTGSPAKVTLRVELPSNQPRDLHHADILKMQAELFDALANTPEVDA